MWRGLGAYGSRHIHGAMCMRYNDCRTYRRWPSSLQRLTYFTTSVPSRRERRRRRSLPQLEATQTKCSASRRERKPRRLDRWTYPGSRDPKKASPASSEAKPRGSRLVAPRRVEHRRRAAPEACIPMRDRVCCVPFERAASTGTDQWTYFVLHCDPLAAS
ncbi:hypothetical protein C8Q78DRAFT_441937 [Trametes maxima]|nr:hypothetical protein C8Q78DRAFT_441937 [Trametes maxima]